MKMRIERKDIYNIQIDDIDTGNFNGCPEGYDDFDVDIDDITQDGDIKIEISGTCKCFGYHDSMPCTFEGTLIMDESEFTSAYTYAAEDDDKYIEFNGNIEISHTSGEGIKLDADYDIDDNFHDTIYHIHNEIETEVPDGSIIIHDIMPSIIINAADKVIDEIKRIDNIDIDKDNEDEYVNYVLNNIIDDYDGELLDDKYKSIDTILNTQLAEDLKGDIIADLINAELEEIADDYTETYEITANVFFSDLD